jgi:hypothetical protein
MLNPEHAADLEDNKTSQVGALQMAAGRLAEIGSR